MVRGTLIKTIGAIAPVSSVESFDEDNACEQGPKSSPAVGQRDK